MGDPRRVGQFRLRARWIPNAFNLLVWMGGPMGGASLTSNLPNAELTIAEMDARKGWGALTLVKNTYIEDWFAVEWAEHEHERRDIPTKYGSSLWYSGRVSDACVEGTAAEMLALAAGLETHQSVEFQRCAVASTDTGWMIWSPRNSNEERLLNAEQAAHLAVEIRRVLA